MDIERRICQFQQLPERFSSESRGTAPGRKFRGYAAVFNVLSAPLLGFREKIALGTFANTIKRDDIRALYNHDAGQVLGRNRSGTLRLQEDRRGLIMEIDPPDTAQGRDLSVLVERGDVNQASFAFSTILDKWEVVNGEDIRTLLEVRLYDVSLVTFPAYEETIVALNSLNPPEGWGREFAQ